MGRGKGVKGGVLQSLEGQAWTPLCEKRRVEGRGVATLLLRALAGAPMPRVQRKLPRRKHCWQTVHGPLGPVYRPIVASPPTPHLSQRQLDVEGEGEGGGGRCTACEAPPAPAPVSPLAPSLAVLL